MEFDDDTEWAADESYLAPIEDAEDCVVVAEIPEDLSVHLPVDPAPAAQIAFQDYMDLGPSRSVAALRSLYHSRKKKDPTSPVPSTDMYTLSQWEAKYNWKALAWEHDADSNRAYNENRKKVLGIIYENQNKRAVKLVRIAEKAMDMLEADIDAGNLSLSPQDALKYMQEGAKVLKESQEALLRLNDPSEQKNEQGGGDFFDTIRKMGLLQINQNNYYGGAS